MPPTIVDSEMADTPTQYLHRKMDEAFFPPLTRKSKLSLGSDMDVKDFRRDRLSHTRGSMPISSGSLKFPTIDRSKSTSVASLSGAHQSKNKTHRRSLTRDREMHGTFRRSPSCPSHIDYKREFSNTDLFINDSNVETDESIVSTDAGSVEKDENLKLPSIFSTDNQNQTEKLKNISHRDMLVWKSDGYRDRTNALGLQDTATFLNTSSRDATARDPNQKTQSQALLLPIKTDTGTNARKKKKRRQKNQSQTREDKEYNNNDHQFSFNSSPRGGCFHSKADTVLDVIVRENAHDEENDYEMNTSRSVKQWISSNGTQKQGNVNS